MADRKRAESDAPVTSRQRHGIYTTFFAAIGLLLAFALYAPTSWTGWLGRAMKTVTRGLFGTLAYVLPVTFLAFALLYFLNKKAEISSRIVAGASTLFVIASSFVSLFSLRLTQLMDLIQPLPDKGWAGFHLIERLWMFGRFPELMGEGARVSGGLIGGFIAYGLERVAGMTGAIILLVAIVIAVSLFSFGLSSSEPSPETSDEGTKTDDEPVAAEPKLPWYKRWFTHDPLDLPYERAASDMEEDPKPDRHVDASVPARRGPRGWETLRYDAAEPAGEPSEHPRGATDPFIRPPDGYRPGETPTNTRAPLTGTPYLFTPAEASSSTTTEAPPARRTPEVTAPIPKRTTSVQAEATLDNAHWEREAIPEKPKKAKPKKRKKKPPKQMNMLSKYQPPPLTLLKEDRGMKKSAREIQDIQELGRKLEETLDNFGVDARVVHYTTGPTITRFELAPAPGVKVSRIVNLADDIALSLAAMGVRIEAPIPGKAAIGIEIPNKKMRPVLLRSLLESDDFQSEDGPLVAALGRDVGGDAILCDIHKMPHLLIAGATGSGKSVCINAILISLLYRSSPEQLRLLMIDPKIVELSVYNGIPHLLQPVVTNPEKALGVLQYAVAEMDRRYRLFAERKARDIASYNASVEAEGPIDPEDEDAEKPLPYILIVIDELADLMAVTQHQVENEISRLMAKARAVGIHVIIATQRPSVDVITGVIKANIPSRIAFAVASQVDSRTIIDAGGAEKLLGKGDMLYFPIGAIKAIRGQGAFVTDAEVERVLTHIRNYYPENYDESVAKAIEKSQQSGTGVAGSDGDEEDELLMDALRLVVEAEYASVSMLQRKLQVGYPRAARLIDRLHELGHIGPHEGSKPRKVLITQEQYKNLTEGEAQDDVSN
jgi:S-DNA-T family DNA segregation ATPase FtsK/SpoIIIE